MAFFPCIYFSALSQMGISFGCKNYKNLNTMERCAAVLERSHNRERFFGLAVKMLSVALDRGLRLVMENPWSEQTFLKANFIMAPTMVDTNRTLRGDVFVKPTAYWFINCEPTHGFTEERPREKKVVNNIPPSRQAGICNQERSMITPAYAKNFICDFILGKTQNGTQLRLFD